ncbi:uncharacterized protein LOC134035324 [Osmerus eperlanus]|uniref:uncharacterized protein LOC134035324 n=1 Tax=Osmerus eperlanus TaxID=29151 RepID=UPI002E131B3E
MPAFWQDAVLCQIKHSGKSTKSECSLQQTATAWPGRGQERGKTPLRWKQRELLEKSMFLPDTRSLIVMMRMKSFRKRKQSNLECCQEGLRSTTPVRADDELEVTPCESSHTSHTSRSVEAFQEIFGFLEGVERRIGIKIERMQEEFRNTIGRVMEAVESRPMRPSEAAEIEILECPCKNVRDLEDLCQKLKDRSFKKKMIRYLSLLGGNNIGDGVRRILKKIGTNELRKGFSLKGRKGKRPFNHLLIFDVVIRACSRSFPSVDCQKVEEAIAVTLKHAPQRRSTNQVYTHIIYTYPYIRRYMDVPGTFVCDVPGTFRGPYKKTSWGRSLATS